jgi:hypothetical protein
MRPPPKSKKRIGREILVLTAEEKRTIAFVLIAFVLGLATKCYRDQHPSRPTAAMSHQEPTK